MYADYDFYASEYGGKTLTAENAKEFLEDASTKIDILTFCRINGIGFDNLTPFQQEKIRTVCCKWADFACENEDIVNSYLSSYSINGVSIDLRSSANLKTIDGVLIPSALYRELAMTGLCYRGFVR